jgi:hypothetical protein
MVVTDNPSAVTVMYMNDKDITAIAKDLSIGLRKGGGTRGGSGGQ